MTPATPGSPGVDAGEGQGVVIGMGGNVGAVVGTFLGALAGLEALGVQVRGTSRLYGSRPLGPAQPDFVNAAVLCGWSAPLDALLAVTQRLEHDAGRVRAERWGPRTLDLDILHAGSVVLHSPTLTVPHASLREREFALRPLLDLVPNLRDPESGRLYRDILAELGPQGVWELADPAWPKALPASGVAR